MNYTGRGPVDDAHVRTGEFVEDGPTVPGLVAAAAWAIGLAVGLFALVAGHPVVAAVAAVMGLLAPWLGLGWVVHTRRRVDDADLSFAGRPLQLTAR
jgi:hypothetical protein